MSALFAPLQLRGLTLANRIMVAPMCQYSAIDGEANDWHFTHINSLALSGAALFCIEATHVEAIGRITPSGQVAEFHRCLTPFPGFFGPYALTRGPDGNVWFATYFWNTGQTSPASIASIGRIAGGGEITEFRLGLSRESEPDELVAAPGRIWFNDRGTEAIGTIGTSR